MITFHRRSEEYEARQYDGTRESLADLLQPDDYVPNGITIGMWIVRQVGHAGYRTYSNYSFLNAFVQS